MLLIIPVSKAEKTKFFLKWSVKCESELETEKLDLFCDHFSDKFGEEIKKYLPCATYTTYPDIVAALNNERERLLLGGPEDESFLSDLAGAMGAQYLVSLKMTQMGQSVVINVKCIKMDVAKTLVNVLEQAPLSEDAFEVIESLTEKFFDDLLKYEICPYKGLIKVEVTTDLNVDQKKEYPVYCNEQDKLYKLHYKETKHSEHFWTFEKKPKCGPGLLLIIPFLKNRKRRSMTVAIPVRKEKPGGITMKRFQNQEKLTKFRKKANCMVNRSAMPGSRLLLMMTEPTSLKLRQPPRSLKFL
jgi:hypothetical protein